jgi:periplasmic protein TonB
VSGIRLPLTLSIAGHAVCLALFVFFLSGKAFLVPEPIAKGGVEVVFQPALPRSEAAPPIPAPPPQQETPPPLAEPPPPPEPQTEVVPPMPEAPVVATEPMPPAPVAPVAASEPTPPPPPRKPLAKKPPKPAQRYEEAPPPSQAYLSVPQATPAPAAPPQTAAAATPVPAPAPSPEASAGYRALLSAWLESHKRYPDTARQRGEEGNAVLRFEIDRSGRVIDYSVTKSSGYPDLDESIEQMMRGAILPPFPAGMPQLRMEVSVTVRFSLRR